MMMGTQLVTPNGYKSLVTGVTYYFLSNYTASPYVYLASFWERSQGQPDGAIIGIHRSEFEDGTLSQSIVVAPEQRVTPFWFGDELNYEDLLAVDSRRTTSKKSLADRVDERHAAITPLIAKEREILCSDTPNETINSIARACGKNETRMRVWFITYLAFSREPWALCPIFFKIGHYSREELTRKIGRLSLSRGSNSGWRVDETMAKTIEESYVKYRGQGVTLSSVYSKAMIYKFECKISTDDSLVKRYFHPQGKPFPTYGQYRYHVLKFFGQDNVNRSIYGEVRTRNRLRAPEGRFSSSIANLMEKLEADGRYTNDYPTSPHCKTLLPALCIIVIVDLASSCTVGIGFSLNSETSEAYRMALFCMAIPKKRFAELFGLSLHDGEWECEGLPSFLIADNGPGKKLLAVEFDQTGIPIRECTPGWFAQSKATVESSNPRQVQAEGQPTFVQSDLSPVQMAVREILRAIKDNHKRDVSAKLTPDMTAAGVLPTSAGIWKYMSERGRTDANPVSFERAVRQFLSPVSFKLKSDGAYLLHRCFNSAALRGSGILENVANGQSIEVQGYVLDMCVRHAWLDIHGRIIEVDAVFPLRDGDYQLSLTELQDLASQRAVSLSQLREHQSATESEYRRRFEETTGKAWDAGKRKTGRPSPRSTASRQASTEASLGTAHRSVR